MYYKTYKMVFLKPKDSILFYFYPCIDKSKIEMSVFFKTAFAGGLHEGEGNPLRQFI